MANPEHLAILNSGVEEWNQWRRKNPATEPDLREANLVQAELGEADMHRCDLSEAQLAEAYVGKASFEGAILVGANLSMVRAFGTDFTLASMSGANLMGAQVIDATLIRTDLKSANLRLTNLVQSDLSHADLKGCQVYGCSAWDLNLYEADQSDLIITQADEPEIAVDDLEVAQFVYLLLNNKKIRNVISTVGQKGVLILGRFTPERKAILEALRQELRRLRFLPMLFDFEKSANRDLTETIMIMAGLSLFIVADITDAKSIPQELSHIVPLFPSVPIKPIILASQHEYAMFEHWRDFNNVLPEYRYEDRDHLLAHLQSSVVKQVAEWEESGNRAAAKERMTQEMLRQKDAEIASLRALVAARERG